MAAKRTENEGKYHILKDKQLIVRCFLFLLLAVRLNLLFGIPSRVILGTWYLCLATTNASIWLIRSIGIEAQSAGNSIILRNQTLLINAECTAIYLMIIFGTFILVYPTKWLRKLIGLALGISAIYVANVLRLTLTA